MRQTKAMLEKRLAEVERELERRRLIGAQMANICFNVARGATLNSYERDITGGVRQEWDAIKRV